MNHSQIFKSYYAIHRGNATTIPSATSREYLVGLEFANDAIDEWARTDGVQWPELWTTSAVEDGLSIATGTTDYDVSSMQEPPPAITLSKTGLNDVTISIIKPWQAKSFTSLDGKAYFTGSANTTYTFHLTSADATLYTGYTVDFPYMKLPTQMTGDSDVPEMSDPSFMVHHMVMLQAQRQRNGFLFKASEAKATAKLANMKTKALSGTYGNSSREVQDQPGWGVTTGGQSFFRS